MKIARDVLLILFILAFVPTTQALSEILALPDWNGVKTFFINAPIIGVMLAIVIICLVFILFTIHGIDKRENDKTKERHDELLEAIKNNRPIIVRRFSHGKRR